MRTSNGCWTCRIRRKRCDEVHPVCVMCATLNITCHFEHAKPSWMDGGVRQDEMTHGIRLEIKSMARHNRAVRRQVNRAGNNPSSSHDASAIRSRRKDSPSQASSASCQSPPVVRTIRSPNDSIDAHAYTAGHPVPETGSPESPTASKVELHIAHSRPLNTLLSTFYLDHFFCFLYPFYQPSSHRGGRAWILELMMTSTVFRQIVLRHSDYFYKLIWPAESSLDSGSQANELVRDDDPFSILSQSLQTLFNATDLGQHAHCACRVLTSIMQIHRYEISISNFKNWRTHLDAALALFIQLANYCSDENLLASSLSTIFMNMNTSAAGLGAAFTAQEAFLFSTGLLLFDDIVAAATSRQEPRLYLYHQQLLGGGAPEIELETIIGVKSRVLRHLGEVASLDAWKQQNQAAGSLDGMALAQRASVIMESLTTNLRQLETSSPPTSSFHSKGSECLEEFHKPCCSRYALHDTRCISQAWTHATIIYLITVVSGWQPANLELSYHVNQILQISSGQVSSPLIRTMAWPFCVAGCLADPHQTRLFRNIASTLKPTACFTNVHKAVEIMEWTWKRLSEDQISPRDIATNFDLSMCFRSQSALPLLV